MLRPLASAWSSPPKPMSYAQPSPPMSHTLLRMSQSALASMETARASVRPARAFLRFATAARMSSTPRGVAWSMPLTRAAASRTASGSSRSSMSFAASARARASRLSQVTRMPSPYSALSSKSELPHATPRPSARVQYGAVGRLPA